MLTLELGKDQKGRHKRGIHDQGDFCNFLLEAAVQNGQKLSKFDLVMDTPLVDIMLVLLDELSPILAGVKCTKWRRRVSGSNNRISHHPIKGHFESQNLPFYTGPGRVLVTLRKNGNYGV